MTKMSLFEDELKITSQKVHDYIFSHKMDQVRNNDLNESVLHYTKLGGKTLRPFSILMSCGAVGGNIDNALPLAATVEMYHTWSLIHDDIIDQDSKRRSGETVHVRWENVAKNNYKMKDLDAKHYGLTVGILAGDLQKGWSVGGLLPNLHYEKNIRPEVVLKLVRELDFITLQILVDGEIEDVLYSQKPLHSITEEDVLEILWKKTGSLYRFCGMGGAMVGLDEDDEKNSSVSNISNFTSQCGTAFQIQDDILGIISTEKVLGKPVGSDIREGKRTIPLLKAYQEANSDQIHLFEHVVGNHNATMEEIQQVIEVIRKLGGIDYATQLAKTYIEGGTVYGKKIKGTTEYLEDLPDSKYKDMLLSWSEYLVTRSF